MDLDSPLLLFKNMLHEHPLMVIAVGYLLNIFVLGYAMCVFERWHIFVFRNVTMNVAGQLM